MTDPSKSKDAADAGNDSKLPLREIAERIVADTEAHSDPIATIVLVRSVAALREALVTLTSPAEEAHHV
jgi:hypothetical protein